MIDDADRRLASLTCPPDFKNPTPAPRYDLVVIGGGTAGLVCAAGAAGLGARVALVEQARLGGDCLNTGCVPSKALLRSAHTAGAARLAGPLGVTASPVVDFGVAMSRMRMRRADLAPHDSAARLMSLGVDVFFGTAAFADMRTVAVEPASPGSGAALTLAFRKAVIATGSRPALPPLPGLRETPYSTTDTIFGLEQQPRSLLVLGAGPVGCELAQAFARLGTRVTLFEAAGRVLPREDPDASPVLAGRLAEDGIEVRLGAAVTGCRFDGGRILLDYEGGTASGDALLVATGRAPNVEALALGRAGIETGPLGVAVDDRLRTRNRHVFASGDVCTDLRFTHAADAMSRIVIQNALFAGRRRVSRLVVPWCTFTSPEVAHVGLTASDAAARGGSTVTIPLTSVDRAVIDDDTDGFVRVHHDRGRILGATIVADGAGESIGILAVAMRAGLGLADLASAVFPYPTLATAFRQAGDEFRRSRLTPTVRRVLRYYLRGRR